MNYSRDDLERLRDISSAAISDALDTMSRKQLVLNPPVRLLAGKRIFGPAINILMAVTGEKAHHNAAMQTLDECEAGSVLVLAGEPDPVASTFGPAEIAQATVRKLGGLLTDCPVRYSPRFLNSLEADLVGIACAGVSPASGFGRLKTMALCKSSTCSGVTIETGDLVVGDEFGVVVIPDKYVSAVATVAQKYEQRIHDITRDVIEAKSIRDAVKRHWSIAE